MTKEISCRVLDLFFGALAKKRIPVERLLEGSTYSEEYLRNPNERIEWNEYVRIMRNVGEIWSREELLVLGSSFFSSRIMRSIMTPGRLLFAPSRVYRWVMTERQGVGKQLFPCVNDVYTETSAERAIIDLSLPEGYATCPEFFTVTEGALAELPRAIGLDRAQVSREATSNGVRFELRYPPESGVLSSIRRTVSWPFAARVPSVNYSFPSATTILPDRLISLLRSRR